MTVDLAPGALPVLGHAVRLARAPLPFLTSLPAAGDVVRIRFGPWPAYVVCRPDLVHRVLTDDRTFDKGGRRPAVHQDRLAGHADVMARRISSAIASWRDGQVIDVTAAMHELTMGIVTRVLFAAESRQPIPAGGGHRMMLDRIPTPGTVRFAYARRRLRHRTGRLVEQYRHTSAGHDDVLSLLLTARDENGAGLTDEEIHDEVARFFLAGIEATPALLSWTWLLLDRHPDIRARLQAEIDTVLAGRIAHHTDLPRLDVTGRVITEALRLYPPGWLLTRKATTRADLAGHHIPAGATVAYSPYLAGRQAHAFRDPDRFDPDRWLAAPPARGAFVPFGGGPRKCVGDAFAITQATLTVATVASRWRLHRVPETRAEPVARGVLTPRAALMRVRRRG